MIKLFKFLKNFFSKKDKFNNNSSTNSTDYNDESLFKDANFEIYAYHEIPLNIDCYLMDAKYMRQYEQNVLNFFQNYPHSKYFEPIGYIAPIGVVEIDNKSITLNWFPDSIWRFHGVTINLPKTEFIKCVGSWNHTRQVKEYISYSSILSVKSLCFVLP